MPYNADNLYYRTSEIGWQLKQYKENSEDFRYDFNDLIICPYCGHKFMDSWEYSSNEGESDQLCENCENEFTLTVEYEVKYSTYKKQLEPAKEGL